MLQKTMLILSSTAVLASCERPVGWERDRSVLGPVPMKSSVAYVDSALDRVTVIDTADGVTLRNFQVGRSPVFVTRFPSRDRLAVLSRGEERLRKGQIDEDPQLSIVDLESGEPPVRYPVGSAFDRVAIAANGETAIAYFSTEGFDEATGVLRNPNEFALVDLTRPPSDENPVLRTVRAFGSAPEGVVLSPPMVLPGAEDDTPRVFAFVLASNTLTIMDATHPETSEISLRLDEGDTPVHPREVVFAPNAALAYLRSDDARDVVILNLLPDESDSEGENDFRVAVSELGTGGGPADIAVYDDSADRRIALASTPGRQELAIITADTGEFRTVDTPDPIDRIMLFPSDPDDVPRVAVLASLASEVPRIHMLNLDGVSDPLKRLDVRTTTVAEPVVDVVEVPGGERAMLVHDHDRTVLGLLGVRTGSVAPLQGVGRLDSFDFAPDGSTLVAASSGVTQVGFVDLESLHPESTTIDDAPAQVFALPGGGVFIHHDDPFGRATIVPGPDATRSESLVVSGFLANDYLDHEF